MAFIVAALWAASQASKRHADLAVWILIMFVLLIGIGSGLFHTLANRWSALADVIPITLFIYGYLGFRPAPLSEVGLDRNRCMACRSVPRHAFHADGDRAALHERIRSPMCPR